jgi:hypothetical protein
MSPSQRELLDTPRGVKFWGRSRPHFLSLKERRRRRTTDTPVSNQPGVYATPASARKAQGPSIRNLVDPLTGRPVKTVAETRKAYNHRVLGWKRAHNLLPNSNQGKTRPFEFGNPKRPSETPSKPERQIPRPNKPRHHRNRVRTVETRVHREVASRPTKLTAGVVRASRAARIIRQLPWGVKFLSDVALAFEGRFHIWREPGVKALFEQTSNLFACPEFAICGICHVLCLSTVGPHFGLSDFYDALSSPQLQALCEDHSADMVKNVWPSYEESLAFKSMTESWKVYGDAVVWIPMYRLAFKGVQWRAFWVAETALEIGARFCVPLGVALTVFDVIRAVPSVWAVFRGRLAVHGKLLTVTKDRALKTQATGPVLVQELKRVRKFKVDGTMEQVDSIQETVELSGTTFNGALRAGAIGVGTVVGAPVAVGVGLAGIGVAAGLTLAATPFLAGYAAYKSARGESLPSMGTTSAWRRWRSSANPRHVDVDLSHRLTSRAQDPDLDLEVEEVESEGSSKPPKPT